MSKRLVANLGMLAVSLLIGLGFAEAGLRILGLGYGHQPHISDPVVHHINPPDTSFRVYDPAGEFGGHDVNFDTDGLRAHLDAASLAAAGQDRKAVWVVGDSFVIAREVPDEQTFISQLNGRLDGYYFRNVGVMGFSPVTSYLLVKRLYGTPAKRPAYVLHVLYSNDSENDATYLADATIENGVAVAVPGPRENILKQFRSLYVGRLVERVGVILQAMLSSGTAVADPVARIVEEDESHLSAQTKLYIGLTRALVEQNGGTYVASCIPPKSRWNLKRELAHGFCDEVKAFVAENHMAFVDLEAGFKPGTTPLPFFDRDIHLTETGHVMVADAIAGQWPPRH
jgi:hypothetical protein